jgi:hypothetical protein
MSEEARHADPSLSLTAMTVEPGKRCYESNTAVEPTTPETVTQSKQHGAHLDSITVRASYPMTSLLDVAREYVARGISVIPLEPRGKRPLTDWKVYQQRHATDEELIAWFRNRDDRNIGIVTGHISGLSVIDCDSTDAMKLAKSLGVSNGPLVKTSRGCHLYCAYKDGSSNFQMRDDLPGIDLRSEGGYVVAPPSTHSSGVQYAWKYEDSPLPELPEWVTRQTQQTFSYTGTKTPMADLARGVTTGGRNNALARLMGTWVKATTDVNDLIATAMLWNEKCEPPLPQHELERTVRSIVNAELRKNGGVNIDNVTPMVEALDGEREATDRLFLTVNELADDLMHLQRAGLQSGVQTGWDSLSELYTVRKREFTVITGIPSHGKTTFTDDLMVNLAQLHGHKFGIYSAENVPIARHVASLAEKFVGKKFNNITADELSRALTWLEEHFFFIEPHEAGHTVAQVLDAARQMKQEVNIDALVIDPWNELNHSERANGLSETEYISQALTNIRQFTRRHELHTFLIAHPAKLNKDRDGNYPIPTLYDISGSAHWNNKADNGLVVWRDVNTQGAPVKVYVRKIRFREVGRVGEADLLYNPVTGRLTDYSLEAVA